MEIIEIEGTFMTPEVILNPIKNEYVIRGNSRPENPLSFFNPIFTWFENHLNGKDGLTTLNISLDYFNTSSSKILLDLFELFEKYDSSKIHVIWHYHSDDEDMKEAGEELFELVAISSELKEI
jgi:hypothetical protein